MQVLSTTTDKAHSSTKFAKVFVLRQKSRAKTVYKIGAQETSPSQFLGDLALE